MEDIYRITTDNALMKSIGLGSFTFRTLEAWIKEDKGNNLDYLNLSIADPILDDLTNKNDIYNIMKEILYTGDDFKGIEMKARRNKPDVDNKKTPTYQYITDDDEGEWRYGDLVSSDLDWDGLIDNTSPNTVYDDRYAYRLMYMNHLIFYTSATDNILNATRRAFLEDIYENGGFVTWKSEVKIVIDYDNTEVCAHTVEFKMNIYNQYKKKPKKKQIALKDPIIVQKETVYDASGVPVENKDVARKLKPGTKFIYGTMLENLAAFSGDSATEAVPSGLAEELIFIQNNPHHVAPAKKDKACKSDETKKIRVKNHLNAAFLKGEIYPCSQIHNQWWQPFPVGSGGVPLEIVEPSVDSWFFTYLVTNSKWFFKDNDNNPLTYSEYESAFYNLYYGLGNKEEAAKDIPKQDSNYVQLTSFDFMGASIGGLRNAHGLCNTQLGIYADGTAPEDITTIRDGVTAPFFGCVFPAGYNTSKYGVINTKTHTASDVVHAAKYLAMSIPADGFLFEPSDGDHTAGKIFQKGLTQLPADIALNAHPDSTNGSPIQIIRNMEISFRPDATETVAHWQKSIDNYVSNKDNMRYAWLHADGDSTDSTFDIKPLNNKIVQFRPLRTETYASLEVESVEEKEDNNSQRGYFGTNAWNRVSESPISRRVLERVTQNAGIVQPVGKNNALSFPYNKDLETNSNLPSTNSPFPNNYWRLGEAANGPRPGGGVGIIGAKCTVSANTTLSFEATYIYGMNDEFVFGNPGSRNWFQTFGGGSTYSTLNTTTLHVRTFQHWPDELTIYDPRYFAVFHFNYGVGETEEEDKEYIYYKGSSPVSLEEYESDEAKKDRGYPDGYYRVDKLKYEQSDFRIPTYVEDNDPIGKTVEDWDNMYVASDYSWGTSFLSSGFKKRMRKFDDSNIDISARGKLLPFTPPDRRTFGIGRIWVEDGGEGYSLNDSVFVIDKGDNIPGSGSILELEENYIDSSGTITPGAFSFYVRDIGWNYRLDDFFTYEEMENKTHSYQAAKIKVKETSGIGQGLKAYVILAYMYDKDGGVFEIPKPKLAAEGSEELRLLGTPPTTQAETFDSKPAAGTETTPLTITNLSSNKKYDCFFFYKNDISHVFSSQHGVPSPVDNEQYVELKITSE